MVRRKVRPGREADCEAWLQRLTEGAHAAFSGYLGAAFNRPGSDRAYRSIFRFDSLDHLKAYERSDFRACMRVKAADPFAAGAAWERMTGLAFRVDPPPAPACRKATRTAWRWC